MVPIEKQGTLTITTTRQGGYELILLDTRGQCKLRRKADYLAELGALLSDSHAGESILTIIETLGERHTVRA